MSSEDLNMNPNGEPLFNQNEIPEVSVVTPNVSASETLIGAKMNDSRVSDELVTQKSEVIRGIDVNTCEIKTNVGIEPVGSDEVGVSLGEENQAMEVETKVDGLREQNANPSTENPNTCEIELPSNPEAHAAEETNVGVSLGKENEVETKEDSFREQNANPSTRITYDVSNMGSLVVDLNSLFGKKMIKTTSEQIVGNELPKEGEFAVSDLVWGKVKSHPWWPGQILDPSIASEKAMKLKKKGGYLVAYFGDQTFAWNEPLSLKSFKVHFSQLEKQTTMTSFHYAVNCALAEVSRRVELGLSCSCTPEQVYTAMKSQIVVNAGVQGSACETEGLDSSFCVTSFEPDMLVEFIKNAALYQCDGGDKLEFVMAKAQIASFYRSKGFLQLPVFHVSEGLSDHIKPVMPADENDQEPHIGKGKLKSPNGSSLKQQGSSLKPQNIFEDSLRSAKKERSLTELLDRKNSLSCSVKSAKTGADEKGTSRAGLSSSRKKQKVSESSSSDTTPKSVKRRQLPSKYSGIETPTSRDPKVGHRISSIAGQLAGSPPVLKLSDDKVVGRSKTLHDVDVITDIDRRTLGRRVLMPKEYSSPNEMLSQLCLAARDPWKGYNFVSTIVGFFTDFRDSMQDRSSSMEHKKSEKKTSMDETSVRSRKPSNSNVSSTDSYGHEDMSDSYWTDRIVQSSPDEQLSSRRQKRKIASLLETPAKNSVTLELENFQVDDKKNSGKFSPTALILNFTDAKSIPLESDLNQIFSNFGSLKESETEILRKTKRARVVFERRNDAEAAFSRAGKYEVFGPALVSYTLTPSKASRTKRPRRENSTSLEGDSF